ncbi:hypothetical protein G6F43_004332 [Rhizopus delemar]|nr:hypothetical protein G6F43_004332 [Rhizopus delemar]
MGYTDINIVSLNPQGSVSSASYFEIRFGFETIRLPSQQLCPDLLNGCPVLEGANITIQRSVNLSRIPLYPLADITAQYSAVNPDSTPLICIRLAPVGYQHPTWRNVFIYIPIGFTIIAAITSLTVSLTTIENGEHDIFLFSSNYAMLPGVLRLKTPGFVDLIYYAQFIVTAGQFNMDYPRFHALFTSNFSWSFLLFRSEWLTNTIHTIFSRQEDDVNHHSSVPGLSIYKRQEVNMPVRHKEDVSVNIMGTGMSDFSTAVGMDINGLFFTVLVYFLVIIGACLILCCLTWFMFCITGACSSRKKFTESSLKMWNFTIGVLVRVLTLLYLPLITMAFYQLMLPTHWYITTLAAVVLVFCFLFYGFVSIKLLQIRPRSFIFSELKLLLRYGALYNTFTDDQPHFFVILIVYKSVVAAMIGLFQTSGIAQLVVVLLAEIAICMIILSTFPYAEKSVNYLHLTFGFIRLLVLILNITYLPQVKATTLIKQYVGYTQLAIHCFAFFLFLILQIRNIVVVLTGLGEEELDESGRPPARMVMWRKRKYRPRQHHNLMAVTNESRPQLSSTRHSSLGFNSQTIGLLSNDYYNRSSATMKPDEVQQGLPNEDMNRETMNLIEDYRNNTSSNKLTKQQQISNQKERADVVAESSQPLLSKDEKQPPPLPEHKIMNGMSSSSFLPS